MYSRVMSLIATPPGRSVPSGGGYSRNAQRLRDVVGQAVRPMSPAWVITGQEQHLGCSMRAVNRDGSIALSLPVVDLQGCLSHLRQLPFVSRFVVGSQLPRMENSDRTYLVLRSQRTAVSWKGHFPCLDAVFHDATAPCP